MERPLPPLTKGDLIATEDGVAIFQEFTSKDPNVVPTHYNPFNDDVEATVYFEESGMLHSIPINDILRKIYK